MKYRKQFYSLRHGTSRIGPMDSYHTVKHLYTRRSLLCTRINGTNQLVNQRLRPDTYVWSRFIDSLTPQNGQTADRSRSD